MPQKVRLLYFALFALIFILGIPVLIFYSTGYTFDDTFDLSIRGGIYVYVPEPDTSVFIGNELQKVSGFFQREVFVKNLKPDQYLVLVANDNFWPWAKFVEVHRGEVEPLSPLMVPKVIPITEITSTESAYKRISGLFATSTATTTEAITRRRVKVWHEENKVFAEWQGSEESAPKYFCAMKVCTDPVLVFESTGPIKTLDFYPYRNDAIMLALDSSVYVIEIDKRQYQNLYPLYRGQNPDFRVDNNHVYIKDKSYVAVLDLES